MLHVVRLKFLCVNLRVLVERGLVIFLEERGGVVSKAHVVVNGGCSCSQIHSIF